MIVGPRNLARFETLADFDDAVAAAENARIYHRHKCLMRLAGIITIIGSQTLATYFYRRSSITFLGIGIQSAGILGGICFACKPSYKKWDIIHGTLIFMSGTSTNFYIIQKFPDLKPLGITIGILSALAFVILTRLKPIHPVSSLQRQNEIV